MSVNRISGLLFVLILKRSLYLHTYWYVTGKEAGQRQPPGLARKSGAGGPLETISIGRKRWGTARDGWREGGTEEPVQGKGGRNEKREANETKKSGSDTSSLCAPRPHEPLLPGGA